MRKKQLEKWAVLVPPTVLKIDSVEYQVPPTLGLGHSFFLPVLDSKRAMEAVREHYRPQKYALVWEERIETGMLGIRVWRAA